MKNRFSLKKAEWSIKREKSYYKYCMDLAFSRNEEIELIEGSTYLVRGNEKSLLCKSKKPSIIWYETWLKYK